MRFDVTLAFSVSRDAKRDAGRVNEHSLPAQIQSIPMKADLPFDAARTAKEMNERFLIQREVEKRTPVLKKIRHRLSQHRAAQGQVVPVFSDGTETTVFRLRETGGNGFSLDFLWTEVEQFTALNAQQKQAVEQLRFVFADERGGGFQFVKGVVGNQIEKIIFLEVAMGDSGGDQ